ncbi:MAG: hypothetical protein A2648_02230 [Candidatus Lloydbacteria bacterium RIFCSPHIGHO2_01_FULL_41_20]|uniref:Uncharacterized protein n=1 Tax=Candidatus Lloydbacteria bacterium RIFCSPHIGHO2_01_FULL_41_20 TaxID=1798657 RepID=A0A1G2CSN0_9BACT|nr:MAG: hypothetical protein A2648_02230 [Candidatus Lloydbacteria bacterium RIFCSPHIGHO2_01_FULL_41_20]
MLYVRIFSDLFLIFSVFFLPFWIPLIIGIFFLFRFKYFYEYVFIMFCFDLIYGGGVINMLGVPFAITIMALIIYFVVDGLRERLILYAE